jgi:pyruvate,orthophosphate dikinase
MLLSLPPQGEDVSGGLRNPVPLTDLRQEQPPVFDALMHVERILEKHFRDMQV